MSECFLVTGSEGCVGSWVVKRLLDRQERCVAFDLASDAARLRLLVPERRLERVAFVRGDVRDGDLLGDTIAEHGVTRVVHLAALQIPLVAADPVRGAEVNVVGHVRVFEAVRAAREQVRGLAYASSAAVFGPDGTVAPTSLYGVFKRCNEETARVFAERDGLASVGVRPWAVLGPGRDQGLTSAPTTALKAAVLGVPYRIPFGGRLDLQYAPDVADAFIGAALADVDGAVVGNLRGSVVSVEEFVRELEDARPAARGLVTHGGDPLPIAPEPDEADLRAAIGELPRTELRVAVRETLSHFEERARLGTLRAAEVAAP